MQPSLRLKLRQALHRSVAREPERHRQVFRVLPRRLILSQHFEGLRKRIACLADGHPQAQADAPEGDDAIVRTSMVRVRPDAMYFRTAKPLPLVAHVPWGVWCHQSILSHSHMHTISTSAAPIAICTGAVMRPRMSIQVAQQVVYFRRGVLPTRQSLLYDKSCRGSADSLVSIRRRLQLRQRCGQPAKDRRCLDFAVCDLFPQTRLFDISRKCLYPARKPFSAHKQDDS